MIFLCAKLTFKRDLKFFQGYYLQTMAMLLIIIRSFVNLLILISSCQPLKKYTGLELKIKKVQDEIIVKHITIQQYGKN